MKRVWNQSSLFLGLLLYMVIAVFSGCGDSGSVLKNKTEMSEDEFGDITVLQDGAGQDETSDGEKLTENAAVTGSDHTGSGKSPADAADYHEKAADVAAADSQDTGSETPEQIFVDVCGAVKEPGVYQLPEGSRIYEVIELAGGFLEEAECSLVNQAGILEDGQQIRIYTKQEAEQLKVPVVTGTGDSQSPGQGTGDFQNQAGEQKININQADKSALMTLNGIGETRAEAIIAYRENAGGFSSIEELMQVDGIKEKTYEKLKDKITVQ